MKKFNRVLTVIAILFTSTIAHAACENEAAQHIANKYGVTPIEAKDLGGSRGGEGSLPNREVWVKASDNSTYSVFFFAGDCRSITKDIRWGVK